MRKFLICAMLALSSISFSQNSEFEVWTKVGAEGDVVGKLDWSATLNSRFGSRGVNTFFPQVGLEYKLSKVIRPSIEYRFISDKDEYSNYLGKHRLNFNLGLKKSIERLSISGRIRYQYAFDRLSSAENFNPDFDQAIRGKVGLKYDIKSSIFTPLGSVELFYNPQPGVQSPSFSKVRYALGTALELDGPHAVSMKYQIDNRLDQSKGSTHAVVVSYEFKF